MEVDIDGQNMKKLRFKKINLDYWQNSESNIPPRFMIYDRLIFFKSPTLYNEYIKWYL